MTKKEIKIAAKNSILEGNSKQETFETLKQTSSITKEDLAKIIQSIPSLKARQQYKLTNLVLILLLTLSVMLKMLSGIPIIIEKGIIWFPILFILPIVNVILLWGVATYRAGFHRFVAILTILGLLRTAGNFIGESFEPYIIIDLAFASLLIGLGFYLNSRLCPDYKTVKERYKNSQGQDRIRNVIKFDE